MPFNEQLYLMENPDVANAVRQGMFKSGYDHYLRFGQREINSGQRAALGSKYLAANPDVAQAVQQGMFKSAVDHFTRFGAREIANGSRAGFSTAPTQQVAQSQPEQTPAQQFIEAMGKQLTASKSPQEQLPENEFKAPLRQTFQQTVTDVLNPEQQYYNVQPFKQQAATAAAVNNMGMSGKFNQLYQTQSGAMERQYQDKIDAARQQYEDMIEGQYQNKLKSIADSPTFNTNIGL